MERQAILLFDLMNVVFRWHHVMMKKPLMVDGLNTSAIHGFLYTVFTLVHRYHPTHVVVCGEGGAAFRRKHCPDYKAHRPPKPVEIGIAEPIIEELCEYLGLHFVRLPGAEADDVIATYATVAERQGIKAYICSADKDLSQLVSRGVIQLQPTCRGGGYLELDIEAVKAKWGVAPAQIPEVLALMGDAVDNVPGVTGIGEKGAKKLIQQYGTAMDTYCHRAELTERLRANLEKDKDNLVLSRWLVEVRRDLDGMLPVMSSLLWKMPMADDVSAKLDLYRLNIVKDLIRSYQPRSKGWKPELPV